MVLTREEKERRVLDLYNKGRTYREIAKEARISPRDIGIIVRKAEQNNQKQQPSVDNSNGKATEVVVVDKATQAYKLFSGGKTPVEVAIELGLDRRETIGLYRDVWKLKRLYTLNSVYEQIGEELKPFLKLYKIVKNQGMLGNLEAVVSILKDAAYDIPTLHKQLEHVKNEVETSQYENQKLSNHIVDLKRLEQSHTEACSRLQQDIGYYINQKEQLIAFVEGFKKSNKKYGKLRAIAQEHIKSFLADQKIMISAAVLAVLEGLRMHPNKHSIICSNDGNYDSDSNSISNESIAVMSELRSDYSHDESEIGDLAIVSDTANTLYDRIREWLVEKTITSAVEMEQERRRN